MDARLREGITRFEQGRYLEAQRIFEELRHETEGSDREFYQGWALLAAALFHRDRGNRTGAQRCFDRARAHWSAVGQEYGGLRLDELLRGVEEALGRDWAQVRFDPDRTGLAELDRRLGRRGVGPGAPTR
ncbi:DUF309 domain-containing protein [Deferrisoma sp.]